MADVANRYPQNVAGLFYVDDQCIDCDLCRETAPANFTRDDDGGHTYVLKQPETPELGLIIRSTTQKKMPRIAKQIFAKTDKK